LVTLFDNYVIAVIDLRRFCEYRALFTTTLYLVGGRWRHARGSVYSL
jgi:hypothetical protein